MYDKFVWSEKIKNFSTYHVHTRIYQLHYLFSTKNVSSTVYETDDQSEISIVLSNVPATTIRSPSSAAYAITKDVVASTGAGRWKDTGRTQSKMDLIPNFHVEHYRLLRSLTGLVAFLRLCCFLFFLLHRGPASTDHGPRVLPVIGQSLSVRPRSDGLAVLCLFFEALERIAMSQCCTILVFEVVFRLRLKEDSGCQLVGVNRPSWFLLLLL